MATATGRIFERRSASSFSASPSANPVGVRKRCLPPSGKSCLSPRFRARACSSSRPARGPRAPRTREAPPSYASAAAGKGALVNGRLVAPASAPRRVKQVITAANRIVEKPYRYGGGHTTYSSRRLDSGYDCSGAVSYALHGGGFRAPHSRAGCSCAGAERGPGSWITGLRTRRTRLRRGRGLSLRHLDARPRCPGAVHRSSLEPHAAHVVRLRGAPPARLRRPLAP